MLKLYALVGRLFDSTRFEEAPPAPPIGRSGTELTAPGIAHLEGRSATHGRDAFVRALEARYVLGSALKRAGKNMVAVLAGCLLCGVRCRALQLAAPGSGKESGRGIRFLRTVPQSG